jgi:hypothetical protein
MRAFLTSDWRSGFARLCDGRTSWGQILLLVRVEFVASLINATAKPREGVLGKLCCVPAGTAGYLPLARGLTPPRSDRRWRA